MHFSGRAALDLPLQLSELSDLRILHLNILTALDEADTEAEDGAAMLQLPMLPTGLQSLHLTEWSTPSIGDRGRNLSSSNLGRMTGALRPMVQYVAWCSGR